MQKLHRNSDHVSHELPSEQIFFTVCLVSSDTKHYRSVEQTLCCVSCSLHELFHASYGAYVMWRFAITKAIATVRPVKLKLNGEPVMTILFCEIRTKSKVQTGI